MQAFTSRRPLPPQTPLPTPHTNTQALRLFVHYPFLVRAALYCRAAGVEGEAGRLGSDALGACLRGQTFFSLGLRFLYAFIPLVAWTMVRQRVACSASSDLRCCCCVQLPALPFRARADRPSLPSPDATTAGRHVAAGGHSPGGRLPLRAGSAARAAGS